MATVTRIPLFNSVDFRGIKIASVTPGAGTSLHVATAGQLGADELYIYVYNSDTQGRFLTFEWGGVTAVNDNMGFTIPAQTTLLLVGGLCLRNGLTLSAYASAANVLVAFGYVNKIIN